MLTDQFRLAVDGLRRRKLRSWLTMLGIFIGIAAVVSLIGLGEGLRTAILSQFEFVGTDMVSVQASSSALAGAPGTLAPNPLSDDLPEKIAKVSGVELAFGRYLKGGTIEFNDKQTIGAAVSMPDGDERKFVTTRFNMKVSQGRLLKDGDGRKVLLGGNFGEDSNQFKKAIKAGDSIFLNGIKYDVIGILEKKGSFILDGSVLINTEPMLEDFGDDGTVNVIAVKIKDPDETDRVIADIEKVLRKERDVKEGEEDFSVESAQQTIDALGSTLFAVQLFVYIIAVISLLVGGIGIMNTMYTAVIERTKEIGVMKSIGAKNSIIFTLFFFESGLLGMVGGIIGIILGLIFAYGLAFLGRLVLGVDLIQAHVSFGLIFGALTFSFVIGTIAGVFPALQAAKLQPVDALRSAK